MQKLQLYIEGERLDLFKDEAVSLTQTIQNVKDVSKIFTSFSKTFSLPASKNNNKIFKHYYNFDIVDGFDARTKKAGTIELNEIPFKSGRIKLEGVGLKNNSPYIYKITFFGNTVELPDLIGADKLGSLPFSDAAYIKDYDWLSIRNGLDGAANALITPLITHTQRLYYDSNVPGVDNLYYDSSLQQGVVWNQLKYALRLYEIILEIELKYDILFSRDFFSTTNPTFYNLYMWLHRKSGAVAPSSQVVSYTSILENWTGTTLYITKGYSTVTIPQSTVTLPNRILFNVLELTPTDLTIPYVVVISLNGSPIYTSPKDVGVRSFTDAIIPVANGVYTVSVQHSVAITFSTVTWEFDGEIRNPSTVAWNETVTVSSASLTEVVTFVVSEQIPDVSIMEFLNGLFKMFNLVAYVNDSNTIVVRPLEASSGINYSYYTSADINGEDAPVSYDISSYVDVSKGDVDIALPYKEIFYQYEGVGSFLAKQHNQLFGLDWGGLKYIGGTETDGTGGINYNASTEVYNVKIPFEHFKYERILDAYNSDSTTIQWGYSVNENQQAYIGKPLIFYAIKQVGGTTFNFVVDSSTHNPQFDYWIPSNSLYLNPATGTQNLNFNLEINEYTSSTAFTGTLFGNYHSEYIVDVFNESRRITKVTAYLPLRILYKFKLNDTFVINTQSYLINSITTNLQDGKSEMELLNKVQ